MCSPQAIRWQWCNTGEPPDEIKVTLACFHYRWLCLSSLSWGSPAPSLPTAHTHAPPLLRCQSEPEMLSNSIWLIHMEQGFCSSSAFIVVSVCLALLLGPHGPFELRSSSLIIGLGFNSLSCFLCADAFKACFKNGPKYQLSWFAASSWATQKVLTIPEFSFCDFLSARNIEKITLTKAAFNLSNSKSFSLEWKCQH